MRSTAILTSALTVLATTVSARIVAIAAPKTVAVDTDVKIDIIAENYIQTVDDIAIAFGIQQGTSGYPVGTLLSSKYLGPEQSNIIGNITATVHIPTDTQKGESTLTGSLFSLYGAVDSPDIQNFQLVTKVGDHTSSEYVRSELSDS